eukprot:m.168948 g.168948  ORF g.168948 m.168948 type:complete len:302 (-) comp13029_c0_seq1:1279-2184(-)
MCWVGNPQTRLPPENNTLMPHSINLPARRQRARSGCTWRTHLTLVAMGTSLCLGTDLPGRQPRMIFTTSTRTTTTTVTGSGRHAASTPATSSLPPTTSELEPSSVFQYYSIYPNSAIQAQGQSFFVNYKTIANSVDIVAEECYESASCVSFDFSNTDSGPLGWLHRVTGACAAQVAANNDASFENGTAPGSTFYQLLPSVLLEKGINSTVCYTAPGQYVAADDREATAGEAFGTTVGVFVAALAVCAAFYTVVRHRRRQQLIAEFIDADAPIDDGPDAAEMRAVRNNEQGDLPEDQLLAPA